MSNSKESNSKIDRSNWDAGPWDSEPDQTQWTDESTGLECRTDRNAIGAWCGYVGIPSTHPLYQKHYDEVHRLYPDFEIHCGLTFGGPQAEVLSRDKDPWWFGFDCSHLYDYSPGRVGILRDTKRPDAIDLASQISGRQASTTYRTLEYVQAECAALAKFLAGVTS